MLSGTDRAIQIKMLEFSGRKTVDQKEFLLWLDSIEIDYTGKRQEWEGIVILPQIDLDIIKRNYTKYVAPAAPLPFAILQRNLELWFTFVL